MKAREKMIVLLALALSLVVTAQVCAETEITANGNDLVGAMSGGTSANDGSKAIGSESLNGNDLNSNNQVNTDNSNNSNQGNTAIDVTKKTDIDVTKDSNNDNSNQGNTAIDVTKKTDIDVTKDSNNDNSKNTDIDVAIKTDTRTKTWNTDIKAEKDSAATLNGDANNNMNNNYSKTRTDNSDNSDNSVQTKNSAEDGSAAAQNNSTAYNDSNNKSIEIKDSEFAKDSYNGKLGDVEGGSVAASTGGHATMSDSNNTTDNHSVNNTAGDHGIVANDDAKIEANYDSNNKNKAENGSAANYGSGEASVDSSIHDSHNITTTTTIEVGNVDVQLASSELTGTVTGNTLSVTHEETEFRTGDNSMSSTMNSSGISVLSQNTGVQSMVQQSVNVQVNK